MKLKPLPLIEEINSLPAAKAGERLQALYREFFASSGAQLIADLFRQHEKQALDSIRHDKFLTHDTVQRLLGRIQLIEDLRSSLTAMVPRTDSETFSEADEESEIFIERESYASIPSRLPLSDS
jgi:hypothetical protein